MKRKIIKGFISILMGAPIGILYLLFLSQKITFSGLKSIGIALYVILFSSGIVYVIFYGIILPRLNQYTRRVKTLILVCCYLAGIWLAIAIPFPIPNTSLFSNAHSIEIINTGNKDPLAKGNEVWVNGLYLPGGKIVPYSDFIFGNGWEYKEGVPFSNQKNSVLSWKGKVSGNLILSFVSHPWSGIVRVTFDGNSQDINLYSENGFPKEVNLSVNNPGPAWYYNLLTYFTAGIGIGLILLLFSVVVFSCNKFPLQKTKNTKGKWLIYALPVFLVYFFYLVVYWPGLMSSDSLDQWNQLSTGVFNDWHPAFHTMLEWILTRLWYSPAIIAIFQILIMGSLIGWGLAEFEKIGVPAWANWLTVGVFLILPDFPAMTITLWKDVLYSLSILLLTILALKIVFSRGKWLENKLSWILLGFSAVLAALFRHNGPPVAFGFLIVAIIFFPSYWKKWLSAFVFGIGLWLIITGPFYKAVGVTKVNEGDIIPAISLFGIEAHVYQDPSLLYTKEYNYLTQILPANEWSNYVCDLATEISYSPNLSVKAVEMYSNKLLPTFLKLTDDHPQITLNHFLCATSYIWRVRQMMNHYTGSMSYYAESVNWTIDFVKNNGLNPENFVITYHNTSFPQLRDLVNNSYRPFIANFTQQIFSRPAIYLYLMLIAIGLYAFRTLSSSILLLAIPALLQSGVMAAVAMTPELRYQYTVMLVGALVFLPLLTIPARQSIENPSQKEQ